MSFLDYLKDKIEDMSIMAKLFICELAFILSLFIGAFYREWIPFYIIAFWLIISLFQLIIRTIATDYTRWKKKKDGQ